MILLVRLPGPGGYPGKEGGKQTTTWARGACVFGQVSKSLVAYTLVFESPKVE